MIQRFLVRPGSTAAYRYAARKWSGRLGEGKNWLGGIVRLSELKDEANLFFAAAEMLGAAMAEPRESQIPSGWVRRDSRHSTASQSRLNSHAAAVLIPRRAPKIVSLLQSQGRYVYLKYRDPSQLIGSKIFLSYSHICCIYCIVPYSRCSTTIKPIIPSMAVFNHGYSERRIVT